LGGKGIAMESNKLRNYNASGGKKKKKGPEKGKKEWDVIPKGSKGQ